ncbi:PP2C family protein-serine/threonine phosphatase [Derxia gummosa]|uniref:PP2C family protein-serine/threonine phosphatase n=1 Tax=Derxia gummosa DSM 723 TaxID=1121388 RepID=A0A8B6X931_9BURK|nr:SpoIIE family protein phosphatase [Derxia gummosa]
MRRRILIIDDDPIVRRVLAAQVEALGHAAEAAPDGVSGLDACKRFQPDLVLCDLYMPGLDGYGVIARLAHDHPELPVIVVSGVGDIADAVRALRHGAWDYVTKPLPEPAVLAHAIDGAVERARLRAENQRVREHLETANRQLEASLRALEDDENAGRHIQFTLLPRERLVIDGYECSWHLVTSAILSGDFVDYFAIDERRFGFYIADVSGHGVSSAFVTVLLKSQMARLAERHRLYGDDTLLDPAATLAHLNREIVEGRHGKYLTMFYGVVDSAAGELTYANGGQFPFPLAFDGSEVREIGGKSPPVGLFRGRSWRNQRLPLTPVFALSMFSDGILETLPEPDLTSKRDHLRACASHADTDAHGIADALHLVTDRAPPDDVSILALRRLEPA